MSSTISGVAVDLEITFLIASPDPRAMLFEMDEEVKRLRSRLTNQEEDQQALRDLRGELTILMEKAIKGLLYSFKLNLDAVC